MYVHPPDCGSWIMWQKDAFAMHFCASAKKNVACRLNRARSFSTCPGEYHHRLTLHVSSGICISYKSKGLCQAAQLAALGN